MLRNKTKWSPKIYYAWNWLISSMGLTNRTHDCSAYCIQPIKGGILRANGIYTAHLQQFQSHLNAQSIHVYIKGRHRIQWQFPTSWTILTVTFSIDLCNMHMWYKGWISFSGNNWLRSILVILPWNSLVFSRFFFLSLSLSSHEPFFDDEIKRNLLASANNRNLCLWKCPGH